MDRTDRREGALRAARPDLRALRARCSRTARTRAGGGSSSRGSRPGRATACSTSPPAPARSRASSSGRRAARWSASTRAPRCSPRRARHAERQRSSSSRRAPSALPFADGEFDALTFTYLLRYVDDPAATLRRARACRPARRDGRRPRVRPPARRLAAALGAPRAGRRSRPPGALIGDGWREVGSFLGPSIRELLGALAARAAARGLARRRDRGRRHVRGSRSAAGS